MTPEIWCRNFNLCNIIINLKTVRAAICAGTAASHVVCISRITSLMRRSVSPSFGPGVCRRGPRFPLLPQPSKTKYSGFVALSEYIPPAKIHRPCFLNLAQWSVYLEWKCSERRSCGAQCGWLKGKVMTLSACVFGSCETTAGSSP